MKTAPDPKDILEFQFKQLSHLKISDGFDSVPAACSLVVVDGKHGLIYTACDDKITVLKSGDNPDKNWKKEFRLAAKITHLALNCDCSFLAVTLLHPIAYIYSAASFTQQNLELLREIRLSSTENVYVLDLRWNPCLPGALCTITSDYTIDSFSITTEKSPSVLSILGKLEKVEVLCVAWSPKGKQLVVGCKNGNLLQLKPELKVARSITGPNPSVGSIIALLWISNYQFCAAYLDSQDSRINVLIIDAPKGEVNATFTSYEDITYGSPGVEGEEGGPRYYFEHVPEWGLIVAASSRSSEVAVLGSQDGGTTWQQWQLVDSGRAQLPFVRTSESYPVGLAVDRTSVNKLPWGGEGSTLPHPVPILHILGTSGVLCNFHMVNLIPGTAAVCSPPTEIVSSASQPHMSLPPTETSFNLIGGVTSTPLPKQIDPSQDRPKTTATVSLFGNTPRVSIQPPQIELNVLDPKVKNVDTSSKVDTAIVPSREVNQQENIGIDSNICISTYQEECSLFEKELKSRREVQTIDIGSVTERSQLIEKSEKMDGFLMDLQDTTASLASDISCLKNLLLQTFAWLEETKSRCSLDSFNNPQSHGDNDMTKELRSQMYYVQSQLEQAMRALDHEWLEHINKEKNKMKVPRLEFVYQNMLRHAQIISKEKSNIQSLVKKWKALTCGDITQSLNKSLASISLLSLSSSGIRNTNGAIEQRCRTIASRSCSFSREKQSKLRNLLSRSTTKIIKAATPSPIHDRLRETLSSLAISSPPKHAQAQERRIKSKPEPKPKKVIITPMPPVQAVRSPLASLDRIVANIGSADSQTNNNLQNNVPTLNTTPVTLQIIKIPQVDSKARAAAALLTSQTQTTMGQPRQNKPISGPLFGTPQAVKPTSITPSGIKPVAISEMSPFTSNAPRSSVPPSLPPALMTTGVTASSTSKPFSKIDTTPFTSGAVKTDVPPMLRLPTGISATISAAPITSAVVPAPPLQANPETNFSFASSVQPSTSQPLANRTTPKTSTPTVTVASIGGKNSPLENFSFASKPANSTFSFASIPTTSPPSSATQSLDLSAMGLDRQAPSNTPVENLTPASAVTSNSIFGSTGNPSSATIFGGATSTAKDKTPGTIFGNSGFSSIFSGSAASGNKASAFGGSTAISSVKSSIFGGSTTSPTASIFGGSTASPVESAGGEIPAAPGFESSVTSSSTSIFGNMSSTANTASVFGGNSNPTALGGTTNLPTQLFGKSTTSPTKPPIFAGDSIKSPSSGFGRSPDVKPSVFGGVQISAAKLSPFEGGTAGSSNTPVLAGAIGSSQCTPVFGGTISNPIGGSVLSTVPPVSPNQSIFGGAANPTPATNMGAAAPTPTAIGPAFGQPSTFGAKPQFVNIFGPSKPIFGEGGFANSSFPSTLQPTSGFAGLNTTPMGGNLSANNTFENLAAQEGGLTFDNLAQKQSEPAPPPVFSGKSSFQSWR